MRTKSPTLTGRCLDKTPVNLRSISIGRILKLTSLLLLLLSTLQISSYAFVPPHEIKGRIVNADGSPVPGVSIVITGTRKGVTTDNDGRFSITVPDEKATLQISSVGFDSKTITVGNKSEIAITLEKSIAGLDQLVVVGYGTRKKSDLTGAVGTVKAAQLQERPGSVSQPGIGRKDFRGAGKYQFRPSRWSYKHKGSWF